MHLASLTHWDALLPIPFEQMDETDHVYGQRKCAEALEREMSGKYWRAVVEADPNLYGNSKEDKDAFVAKELKAIDQRSRAWAEQAVSLRAGLNLRPVRVAADGACALSSLSVAEGGRGSDDEKEYLRKAVLAAAPKIFEDDDRYKKLLFILEGEPAHHQTSGQQPAQDQPLLGRSAGEGEAGVLLAQLQTVAGDATAGSAEPSVLLAQPTSAACASDSRGILGADVTGAKAKALEVDAAPQVATASVPPDAPQIAVPPYPWRGGARPAPRTGDGDTKAETPILTQTQGSSRSRSRSRSLSRTFSSSQLSQTPLKTAGGQTLENPAFGISFGGVRALQDSFAEPAAPELGPA